MKIARNIFLGIVFFTAATSAKDPAIGLTVKNPASIAHPRATIALAWIDVYARLQRPDPGNVSVIDKSSGKEIMLQVIDCNSDGTPDEIIFQSDFDAQETRSFLLQKGTATKREKVSLVDGLFVEPRQDYAWENDRIAFRMYGPAVPDVDNGIDVWTKRVRSLIVRKWYKGEEQEGAAKISYHQDHGEGADFFAVGKSLGCGSCGLWQNDSLRQPGNFLFYRTIANGPIRIAFEVSYPQWTVGGKRYLETKRISLDAGSNLNKIDVTYQSLHDGESLQIAAGIVKRKGVTAFHNEANGWISLWGPTNDDPVNESLGMGVVMMKKNLAFVREAKDHSFIIAETTTGATLTYYSGAAWTRQGDFSSSADWNGYLNMCSQWIASPLIVTYGGN